MLTGCASDMTDATSPDLEKRQALASQVRDACLNVGFFYGKHLLLAAGVGGLSEWEVNR